jgi:hypothetical protein
VALSLNLRRILFFVFVTVVVYATSLVVLSQMARARRPDVLATAVLVDLVVFLPGIYFVMFLRGKKRALGITPVFLLSLAGAALVLPAQYRGLLPRARLLALPAELALGGYLIWRVRQAVGQIGRAGDNDDVLEALTASIASVIPNARLANMLAYETSVFYYALLSWFKRPQSTALPSFSYHRRRGYGAVLFVIIVISAVEIPGLHIMLHSWSPVAAWVMTALGVYAVLWMIGDFQGMRHRPIIVSNDGVRLRLGLRWSAFVPFSAVAELQPGKPAPSRRVPGYLRVTILTEPQFLVTLREPLVAHGPYGITKQVTFLGIAVDEGDRLRAMLQEHCGRHPASAAHKSTKNPVPSA